MMLTQIPAWHVPDNWSAISAALAPAIARDPQRDAWTVLDQAVSCDLDFWEVEAPLAGFVVTQKDKRTFWVIYAGGQGGSFAEKRALMREIEQTAKAANCTEVKFEGRDWRKVFPDYEASKSADGRFHYRKRL